MDGCTSWSEVWISIALAVRYLLVSGASTYKVVVVDGVTSSHLTALDATGSVVMLIG
jgi:hypothetical protein